MFKMASKSSFAISTVDEACSANGLLMEETTAERAIAQHTHTHKALFKAKSFELGC